MQPQIFTIKYRYSLISQADWLSHSTSTLFLFINAGDILYEWAVSVILMTVECWTYLYSRFYSPIIISSNDNGCDGLGYVLSPSSLTSIPSSCRMYIWRGTDSSYLTLTLSTFSAFNDLYFSFVISGAFRSPPLTCDVVIQNFVKWFMILHLKYYRVFKYSL